MMTMMALGVAMAFVSERPVWQRLAMILACVPIAIFCNIVPRDRHRIPGGVRPRRSGPWRLAHDAGPGMLFIAFGLYGAISYILNNLTIDSDPDEDAGERPREYVMTTMPVNIQERIPLAVGAPAAAAPIGAAMTPGDIVRILKQRVFLVLFIWLGLSAAAVALTWYLDKHYSLYAPPPSCWWSRPTPRRPTRSASRCWPST